MQMSVGARAQTRVLRFNRRAVISAIRRHGCLVSSTGFDLRAAYIRDWNGLRPSRPRRRTEREGEFLWKTENLAELLQVKVGTVKRWMLVGLITEADGWIKAGRLN